MEFNFDPAYQFLNHLAELAAFYLPKVLLALFTLLAGLWLIKILVKGLMKLIDKRGVDPSLKPFLTTVTGWGLRILLIVTVASMIGIETTSFIAVLGAASLAIGLALQGSLSNFAGGVLLLSLKPFRVGDFITAPDYSGTVQEIQIFYTILKTPQGQKVVIPNGKLSNGSILNYSAYPTRRLDLVFGIGYDDDVDLAKNILLRIIHSEEKFINDPEPAVVVEELADSSVNIKIKVWVSINDYWDVIYKTIETGKKELESSGISIPYPQRDVHLMKEINK